MLSLNRSLTCKFNTLGLERSKLTGRTLLHITKNVTCTLIKAESDISYEGFFIEINVKQKVATLLFL